ncbi:ChaN family lipoprotein, partial [Neptunomonas phycophila]|uniref:ChaN family lipoprotein n=2 Tax=Oceanospirillaceae TaxID=135620 RepID=UPI003511359F
MMKHLASLITSLSLFLAAAAPASQTPNTFMPVTWQSPLLKDHPLVGHIIALESQRSLSPTELVSELSQYPIVLIGEKHDNTDHHQIETWLIQQLYPSDSANTSLVLEMLDDSQTTNTIISGMSDSDLKQRLNWQDDSWPWQDYGPLIKAALEQNMPVHSGNISRDAIQTIYKAGVPKTQRFATTQGITQAVKDQVLDQVYESHCQLMQRNQLAPMVSVQ